MSKKEKAKPRKQKSLDETVFKKYLKEMEEIKENSNIKQESGRKDKDIPKNKKRPASKSTQNIINNINHN